ncbi:hypothetical protein PHISP_02890 [Aspergillus sp. HF37]|nr:hypothetical protein PHISP_02890 [Aspergillus sp. HF37]
MSPPVDPSFEWDVPPELRLTILDCTGDLAYACSLIYASPKALQVFSNRGSEVIGSIVDPGERSELNDMIRMMIGVRLSQIGGQSVGQFHQRYVRAMRQTNNGQTQTQAQNTEPFYPPLPNLPSSTNHKILFTAYQVWWHTQACLKHYMDRLMSLQPSHTANPMFQYTTNRPWHERPAGHHFPAYHAGPPSYEEEYLIARTFWRLQVEHELKNAAVRGHLNWPAADIELLFSNPRVWLWGDDEDDFEPNEAMDTVLEYLSATEAHWSNHLHLAHDYNRSGPTRESRLPRPMYALPIQWPAASQPPTISQTNQPQPAIRFWDILRTDQRSPLPFVPFDPFRRLGFAIWDLERLRGLGLLTPDESHWADPSVSHGLFFAWRSILTTGQLAPVDIAADQRRDAQEGLGGVLGVYRQQVIP